MAGTSSAKPSGMDAFLAKVAGDATDVTTAVNAAGTATNEFEAAPCDPQFRVAGLADGVQGAAAWTNEIIGDDNFVTTVRNAFVTADAETLPDANIDAALAHAGISQSSQAPVTVNDPVYNGATMMSGWSDDPVCTATGHFFEVEEDLVMPESLRVLRWARSYSSRFVVDGPGGRGWSSLATTRLELLEGQIVRFWGLDGRRATVVISADDRPVQVAGVEGSFVRQPEPDPPSEPDRHSEPDQLEQPEQPETPDAEPPKVAGRYELRWRWTSPWPGMTWHFDADGQLVRIDDPYGGTTICTRGEDGRLEALTHEGGRSLRLVWDGPLITGLDTSDGRQVRYRYDGADLIGIERADGGRRYRSDGAGRIVELHDADGVRLMANTYDDEGRVTSQTAPTGRVSIYRYLAPHTVTVSDETGGPATVFRHDGIGRLVELRIGDGRRESRTFDDAGNPVHVVGLDGGEIVRTFDVAGNCTSERGADGAVNRWSYDTSGRVTRHQVPGGGEWMLCYEGEDAWPTLVDGPNGDVRRFTSRRGLPLSAEDADGVSYRAERDSDGSITAIVDGEGGETCFGVHRSGAYEWIQTATGERTIFDVDDAGRTLGGITATSERVEVTRSAAGRLVSHSTPGGGGVASVEWDPAGQVAAVTDPSGGTTILTHDALGDVTDLELPGGGHWQLGWTQAGGIDEIKDPVGGRWELSSDRGGEAMREPSGAVHRFDTNLAGTITAGVSPSGRRTEVQFSADGRHQTTRSATGAVTEVERDDAGRIVTMSEGSTTSRWTYTSAGRMATIDADDGGRWSWTYDRAGRVRRVSGPQGITTFERDRAGRMVALVEPSGARREVLYGPDGRPAEVRQGGRVTRMTWDTDGRLHQVVQPDGAIEEGTWDAAGRLMTTTDPLGAVTRIDRDIEGQVLAVEAADGARWTYRRDPMGRPTTVIDPLGRATALAWDGAGRLERFGEGAREQRYRWNLDGELLTIDPGDGGRSLITIDHHAEGRGMQATDGTGLRTRVTWDPWGRLTRCGADDRPTVVEWDDQRSGVSITPPGGAPSEHRYGPDGQVTGIDHPVAGRVRIRRDPEGRVVHIAAAGLDRTWERDDEGRPVTYTETRGAMTSVTVLTWDEPGRLVAEARDGSIRRYGYDLAGQLTAMDTPDGAWTWAYDPCGRLIRASGPNGTRELSYDPASQLIQVTHEDGRVTRYRYDDLGRRAGETGDDRSSVTYHWDELGRLRTIERADAAGEQCLTQLTVGPLGELHDVDGVAVDWCPTGPIVQAPAALGGRDLLSVDGHPLAFAGPGGAVEWLSADWSGSLGDAPTPWGPTVGSEIEPGARLGWCGEIEAGGLVWLRNRVYDPTTCAFLSRDSLGGELTRPGALTNPYQYAGNDPVNHRDPSGLRPVTAAAADKQIASWTQPQWGKIASVAEAVGGVALCFTPLAPIGAGILIGEATSIGSQAVLNHGQVNWNGVAIAGAAGGVAGGVGMVVGPAISGSGALADLSRAATGPASRFLVSRIPGVVSNAAGGLSGGVTQTALSGGQFSPVGLATDTLVGGATGGVFKSADTTFSGHGTFYPSDGLVTVPKGTTLTMYSPHGNAILDDYGNAIEVPNTDLARSPFHQVFGPSDQLPNYTLGPRGTNYIAGTPIQVTQDTPLTQLLKPNMGAMHWAACRANAGDPNPPITHLLPASP